ncbi:MAG: hypothetical protein CMK59_12920 [Proteobacteria bacterium]|nr:hypothetical protein [Pseudomonadota bacterium]
MRVELKSIEDIQLGLGFPQPTPADIPKVSYKCCSLRFALRNTTPYVQNVLRAMPIQNRHKRVLVDIKVHHLKPGDVPAIPGWHIDGTRHILDERKDNLYHLFVSGISCLPQFLKERAWIDVHPEQLPNYDSLLADSQGQAITSCVIHSYDRYPHRAVPTTESSTRLLIRAVETDRREPHNRAFNVGYYTVDEKQTR